MVQNPLKMCLVKACLFINFQVLDDDNRLVGPILFSFQLLKWEWNPPIYCSS